MGRTKALLEIAGESFLRRVVRALSDAGCDPVYVIVSGAELAVADEAAQAGATVLTNPDPGEGPITSLRIALSTIGADKEGVVYLPVDHPLVRPDTVAALIAAAMESGADLTLPVYGSKRGHPAVFRRSLFPELLDPQLSGGARTVVHRHLNSACLFESPDEGVIIDVDTPEAYEAALQKSTTPTGTDG